MTGVTHSAIAKYPGPFPGGKAKENLLSSIRKVASRAEDVGVIFGLEIVNRYESNVLNTAAQVSNEIEIATWEWLYPISLDICQGSGVD